MTYYADLSSCDYFGRWQDVLQAVGWLELNHSSTKGEVSKDFFAALMGLAKDPWQPVAVAGHQRCDFCRFSGGPSELRFEGGAVALGTANIFVPAKEHVYVSPTLIVHYIDAHGYAPPDEYQEAVLRCPQMKSFAYLKEMKVRGLKP